MNYFFAILFPAVLLLTSCLKDQEDTSTECDAGYHQNEVIGLPDGQNVRIIEVNDNYCPCNVQCVWAGYLEVIVQVEGANRGPDTLGWRDRVATIGDYALRLGEIYNEPSCGGELAEGAFCFEVVVE